MTTGSSQGNLFDVAANVAGLILMGCVLCVAERLSAAFGASAD